MRKTRYSLAVVIGITAVLLALAACSSGGGDDPVKKVPSVYLPGWYSNGTHTVAAYWIDKPGISRTKYDLCDGTTDSHLYSIVVSGGAVYGAGDCKTAGGVIEPFFWNNGTRVTLPVDVTGRDSAAYGFNGVGSGAYLTGYTTDSSGNQIPCYWYSSGGSNPFVLTKLDMATSPGSQGQATSVVVVGSTVYFAGSVRSGTYYYPACWQPGAPTPLTILDTGGNWVSYPTSGAPYMINVIANPTGSGWPVWFVGSYNNGTRRQACYWTDTATAKPLSDHGNPSSAFSMISDGTKIYISGCENDGTRDEPCYWYWSGAGTPMVVPLSTPRAIDNGAAYGMFISEGKLYLSGYYDVCGAWWEGDSCSSFTGSGYNSTVVPSLFVVPPS